MCELHYKRTFYGKTIIKLFKRKNNNKKALRKHVTWQNHFVVFRINKNLGD